MEIKPQLVCTSCGNIGQNKKAVQGTSAVEFALFFFGVAVAIFITWMIGLVVILGAIAYSIYRSTTKKNTCAKCSGTSLIPLDTPMGQKILKEMHSK
jgi:hypothetical protein